MANTTFDYVKFDDNAQNAQQTVKAAALAYEDALKALPEDGKDAARAKALAITNMQQSFHWAGTCLRADQIKRNEGATQPLVDDAAAKAAKTLQDGQAEKDAAVRMGVGTNDA